MAYWIILVLIYSTLVSTLDAVEFESCGCQISRFESGNIANCSAIPKIDFDCLSDFTLHTIKMRNNNYSVLPVELQQHDFSSLKLIDLSNNQITYMPDDWIKGFTYLSGLILDHNQLTNASDLILNNAHVKIDVHNNPFECDCKLAGRILSITNKYGQTIFCTNKGITEPTSIAQYCVPKVDNSLNIGIYLLYILAFVIIVFFIQLAMKHY